MELPSSVFSSISKMLIEFIIPTLLQTTISCHMQYVKEVYAMFCQIISYNLKYLSVHANWQHLYNKKNIIHIIHYKV